MKLVSIVFLLLSIFLANPAISQTSKFRIVLDPGHGGRDSATKADGFYEKDIVLNIAKAIAGHLSKSGYQVVMTRQTDEYISLPDRASVSGDVFISLHANTVPDSIGPSVRTMIKGIEIFTSTNPETSTPLHNKSKLLAAQFQQQLSRLSGIKLRGVKQKPFAILAQNQSPAILIELGYISNKDDLNFLINPNNHKQFAQAFLKAVQAYQQSLRLMQ